jgi:hypothetical protein
MMAPNVSSSASASMTRYNSYSLMFYLLSTGLPVVQATSGKKRDGCPTADWPLCTTPGTIAQSQDFGKKNDGIGRRQEAWCRDARAGRVPWQEQVSFVPSTARRWSG